MATGKPSDPLVPGSVEDGDRQRNPAQAQDQQDDPEPTKPAFRTHPTEHWETLALHDMSIGILGTNPLVVNTEKAVASDGGLMPSECETTSLRWPG